MSNQRTPSTSRAEQDQIASLRKIEVRAWQLKRQFEHWESQQFDIQPTAVKLKWFTEQCPELKDLIGETKYLANTARNSAAIPPEFKEVRINAIIRAINEAISSANKVTTQYNEWYNPLKGKDKEDVDKFLAQEERKYQYFREKQGLPDYTGYVS
jgi:hypothetical protein